MSEEQIPSNTMHASRGNSLGIPVAIVIAAALIAGAIIFTGLEKNTPKSAGTLPAPTAQATPEVEVAPVTKDDHILGNPNAPIMIVEYSDYDCPFCKNFHETMNKVMAEFGADGQVAWVYRHFPLSQLHPNASKIAEAAECVAELGGNDAFWKFSDLVFGERGRNEPTNMLKLPEFAVKAGVDETSFTTCLNSGKYTSAIAEDVAAAMETGARGTPYSFLIAGDQKGAINGAQQLETVRQMIQTVLAQMEAGS